MITQICWYLDVISIMSIDCPKCDEYFIPNILKTKMSKLLTENNNLNLYGYPIKSIDMYLRGSIFSTQFFDMFSVNFAAENLDS